jgi:hypothetical protein
MPDGSAGETDWDAVRAQSSYRAFIWFFRVWLAMVVGLVVAVIVTPTVSASWVAASGAGAAVSVVLLFAVSLRRAGVPLLQGLTDRGLAHVIIFEDLFGEITPGSERPRGTPR